MRPSLDDLYLFCRIVETRSLRAAATEIGIDPSNVTRRLSAIEARLGVRLVTRSRVRSAATEAGQLYYRSVKDLLERLDALEDEVTGATTDPRGRLRVAAPSVFGARHVAPWLHELQVRSPRLEIDLVLADRPVDLVEQGIDVAVRIGKLPDSSLAATKLGSMRTAVVAARKYLVRRGIPTSPDDLAAHAYVKHAGLQDDELVFEGPRQRTVTVTCRSRFTVSSILGVLEAVIAGAGFNAGPLWLYADAIARGDLVHLMPHWRPPSSAIHALVLPGRHRPAKIATTLELLRERVPRLPGVSRG
jgi:DNA-binding transcriptional LysR family regulator